MYSVVWIAYWNHLVATETVLPKGYDSCVSSIHNRESLWTGMICIGRGTGRFTVGTNAEAVARVEAKWKRDFDRKSVTCIIEGDHDNKYISTFAVIHGTQDGCQYQVEITVRKRASMI